MEVKNKNSVECFKCRFDCIKLNKEKQSNQRHELKHKSLKNI